MHPKRTKIIAQKAGQADLPAATVLTPDQIPQLSYNSWRANSKPNSRSKLYWPNRKTLSRMCHSPGTLSVVRNLDRKSVV